MYSTIILISIFAIGYIFFISLKAVRHQLDIYDLVILSSVAIVPVIFVTFPQVSSWLANIAGVKFPFVIMFGILFAILFIFVHRLTLKINRLESDSRLLIQELSLLKQSINSEKVKNNAIIQDRVIR